MKPDLSRRWAIGAAIVLLVLVGVMAVQTWTKAARPTDLAMYLEASRALWTGGDPYAPGQGAPFIYPLFLCVALWPLWHLPLAANVSIWFVASIAAAVVSVIIAARLHGDLGRHRLIVAAAIVSVCLADMVQSNLRNGQVNFIVLAACLAFVWCWTMKRGALASASLGAAIALKITPAIFLVMLAARREWRRVTESIAVAAVLAMGLPWLVAGTRVVADTRGYIENFLLDRAAGQIDVAELRPLSLPTFLHKYVGTATSFDVVLISLAVVAVVVLAIDRGAKRTPAGFAMLVCLYLSTIVVAAPMTEAHHLAFLLPGLVLLVWRALAGELASGRLIALSLVLLSFVVMRRVPGAAFAGTIGSWMLLADATATGVFRYR